MRDAADAECPSDAAINPRAATRRWPEAHGTLLKLHWLGLLAVQPQVDGGARIELRSSTDSGFEVMMEIPG